MPWDSVQQARWGHSSAGKKALGKKKVKEFDNATPEGSLAGTRGSKEAKKRGRKPVHSESHMYDHHNNAPVMMGR